MPFWCLPCSPFHFRPSTFHLAHPPSTFHLPPSAIGLFHRPLFTIHHLPPSTFHLPPSAFHLLPSTFGVPRESRCPVTRCGAFRLPPSTFRLAPSTLHGSTLHGSTFRLPPSTFHLPPSRARPALTRDGHPTSLPNGSVTVTLRLHFRVSCVVPRTRKFILV